MQHWLPFAEQGSIVSQLNVGLIFAEGMGTVAKDGAKAAYWYTRAADRGNSTAQIRLGDMYAIGFGVPYDRKQAFILYEKSAKQGDPRGQLSLGEAYIKGIGVLKSPIDAAYWVKKAYDNGLIRAGYIWDEYDLWKY